MNAGNGASELVGRLRARRVRSDTLGRETIYYVNPDGPEAADRITQLEQVAREVADAANDMIETMNDQTRVLTPADYNAAGKRLQDARDRIDALLEPKT